MSGPGPIPPPRPGPPPAPQPFFVPPFPAGEAESPVLRALRGLGPLLAQRLLGALELTLDALELVGVPTGLAASVPAPSGSHLVTSAMAAGGGELEAAVIMLDQARWGASTLTCDLVRALCSHPLVAPLLAAEVVGVAAAGAEVPGGGEVGVTREVPAGGEAAAAREAAAVRQAVVEEAEAVTAEEAVAAGHGAAHLALAVAVSVAVLRELGLPAVPARPPAVVGLALGAAAHVLAEAPVPAAYAPAALARRRAEYRLPRGSVGRVSVAGHCFALAESGSPALGSAAPAAFAANGLVETMPGGALIRTGTAAGSARVRLAILQGPPAEVELDGWDEVVEVSWTAAAGSASVVGAGPAMPAVEGETPPWPGTYRLRVHARDRDDGEEYEGDLRGGEGYLLVVWEAPAAPEVVYRRSDQLGHRLRGEPPPAARPEAAYRWVRHSPIGEAATVTVVPGADVAQVLRAFGADAAEPVSMAEMRETWQAGRFWVAVLAVEGAVLAVEDNGFQGTQAQVLRALSRRRRAASMFWNVNAVTRLSLAEHGRIVASFEPGLDRAAEIAPGALPYLEGMDLTDHRHKVEKCLVAVERFTHCPVRPVDIERVEAAGVAYLMPGR
ncbi:conserved hypothetical protein [Parafrankia sp. EAN1pec]|nr:conserved hypothetical protein [Frankia sp. EAN1pec]